MKAWVLLYVLMSGDGGQVEYRTEMSCIIGQRLFQSQAMIDGNPVDVSVCSFREEGDAYSD